LKCLGQPVEPIALAGDGDDETRLFGIGLNLAAQSADQHVDAAVERLEAPARHASPSSFCPSPISAAMRAKTISSTASPKA